MEKLQNETAMYTRLVYIDTVGHDATDRIRDESLMYLGGRERNVYLKKGAV
jgi:hypothetical protein